MRFWKLFNLMVYAIYYRLRGVRSKWMSRRAGITRRSGTATTGGIAAGEAPVLYVAWGRIGDLVLATGHIKHLRTAFPGQPIWCLGRHEVEVIVRPYIDTFIGFREHIWLHDTQDRRELIDRFNRKFACVIADIHMFYGGAFVLGAFLSQLRARQKFIYEGYHLGRGLAPWRLYPDGFTIVPQRPRIESETTTLTTRHVLHDAEYYFRILLERCGKTDALPSDMRPALICTPGAEATCRRFNLEPGSFIAWQPISNNRKKDYPIRQWHEILDAFPDRQFVALGTMLEHRRLQSLSAQNLVVLAGRTDLVETIHLIRSAGLFAGLDSGLSHIAAVTGQKTVCVTQNSNLGYYFPYPERYGFTNLRTVYHPDFVHCSGCFMTCQYESILTTYRKGALCLRRLPAAHVVDAIRHMTSV